MTDEPKDYDWSKLDVDIARRIVDSGEAYVQAQLQAGLASDQRSMNFASIMTALCTAVAAGAITLASQPSINIPQVAGASVGAVLFAVAALCALWAARPIDFRYPGNEPRHLLDFDPYLEGPLSVSLTMDAFNLDKHVTGNAESLDNSCKWYSRALLAAGAAPILGAATFVICLLAGRGGA